MQMKAVIRKYRNRREKSAAGPGVVTFGPFFSKYLEASVVDQEAALTWINTPSDSLPPTPRGLFGPVHMDYARNLVLDNDWRDEENTETNDNRRGSVEANGRVRWHKFVRVARSLFGYKD